MEFVAKVLVCPSPKGVTGYLPMVEMFDGATQWTGEWTSDKESAQKIANKKADSYNEA